MLEKFLTAMARTASGFARTGYALDVPVPGIPLPRWHPDALMLPPLSREERETFEAIAAAF